MKYLYRAYFNGDTVQFDRYLIRRETAKTYFISYKGKEKRVLKLYSKEGKKVFARETRIEAYNDLYVRTQISLRMITRAKEVTEDRLKAMQKEIKFYRIEEKEIGDCKKKLIIDTSDNVKNMEKELTLGDVWSLFEE